MLRLRAAWHCRRCTLRRLPSRLSLRPTWVRVGGATRAEAFPGWRLHALRISYHSMGRTSSDWPWSDRGLIGRAIEAANRTGDLTFAAYSITEKNVILLAAGDPLVDVQREVEESLDFAQRARVGFAVTGLSTQLGLVRTLRGLTPAFGSFDDEQFDESGMENSFEHNPGHAVTECCYWIVKLQARFLAGDFLSATKASSKAQPLLWTLPLNFVTAEYHFYGALSCAASCASSAGGQLQQQLEALALHHKQLQVWAENCPENFENRAALVGAEIARIEGRPLHAMDLYE